MNLCLRESQLGREGGPLIRREIPLSVEHALELADLRNHRLLILLIRE